VKKKDIYWCHNDDGGLDGPYSSEKAAIARAMSNAEDSLLPWTVQKVIGEARPGKPSWHSASE
jgi:hypothetical protein